ncbi:hypothetical protein MP228_003515 [Amoeboaphelidium protococcarum]|nr:hypothetical protein MP228_003515 [Amoeboaphelidium protococcarum]
MDSYQSQLPKLPVPDLKQTVQKLYKSLLPYIKSDDDASKLQQLCQDFVSTHGPVLQARLLKHAEQVNNVPFQPMVGEGGGNWLDKWWLDLAYLSWREPLIVNSNWFLAMKEHPQHPQNLKHYSQPPVQEGRFTSFQIHRAAGFITNALNMKEAIDNRSIEAELMGRKKIPLCMNQYRLMFGMTRVPLDGCDTDVCSSRFTTVQSGAARHITVLVKDHVYHLDCYIDTPGGSGVQRLSISALEKLLWDIVSDAQSEQVKYPVGILTADQRDNWAQAHKHLLNISKVNKDSFENVRDSLFCIALDDVSVPTNDFSSLYSNTAHGLLRSCDSLYGYGRNRWFDKTLTVIVMSDGSAGINGEHSPCDALIPSRFIDWLVENEPARDVNGAISDLSVVYDRSRRPNLRSLWSRLQWQLDDTMKNVYIPRAINTANHVGGNSDAGVLIFTDFGGKHLKSVIGKISPDAFIQMCLQLAFYKASQQIGGKAEGEWCAVYETASTRQFLKGRTECIRSCSVDSVNFLKLMVNKNASFQQKYDALQKAGVSHTRYTIEAMSGQGVDRHILGLKVAYSLPTLAGENMKLDSANRHPLFSHPAMLESTRFRLSTSSLSSGVNYNGTGFGTVEPDGYGINYCVGDEFIKFGIESKKGCRETSTAQFKIILAQALLEVSRLCETVNASNTPRSAESHSVSKKSFSKL